MKWVKYVATEAGSAFSSTVHCSARNESNHARPWDFAAVSMSRKLDGQTIGLAFEFAADGRMSRSFANLGEELCGAASAAVGDHLTCGEGPVALESLSQRDATDGPKPPSSRN